MSLTQKGNHRVELELMDRNCYGFTWDMGQGMDFCTPEKSVPVAWVHGFQTLLKNAKRVPAHHSFLPTITCQPPQQSPNSWTGIEKEGK